MDLGEADRLGRALLDEHGLGDWTLAFDGAKRRAGVTRHQRKVIGLSFDLTRLHSEEEVRETLLHEIAHALVGAEHGHDEVWRRMARQIGSTGERCVSVEAPRLHGAWVGVCPQGHQVDRHRAPDRVLLCRQCAGLPTLERIFTWTRRGRVVAMHANYQTELDGLLTGRARLLRPRHGQSVRITAAGPYHGRVGTVVSVGRSWAKVQLEDRLLLKAVFAVLEPA